MCVEYFNLLKDPNHYVYLPTCTNTGFILTQRTFGFFFGGKYGLY